LRSGLFLHPLLYNCCLKSILHQHCNCHGPNAAGNRCDCTCNLTYLVVLDVSAELAVFVAVHTYVDYDCTLFNHICSNEFSLTDCRNENICTATNFFKILCTAVTDCDSSVFVKKKHCLRFTHDVASSYNYTLFSAYVNVCQTDKFHNACRCAGEKIKVANHNLAHIYGMECIDILFGKNSQKHLFAVNTLGKRKLYQYSINFFFIIKSIDKLQEFFLSSLFGKGVFLGIKSALFTSLFLVIYINAACRVITYYNYRKARVNSFFL